MLQGIFNTLNMKTDFTDDEARTIRQIIAVNGLKVAETTTPYTSIYELASSFEHSCRPNCHLATGPNGLLTIIAGMRIKEGDHLNVCYTNSLWPTFQRQQYVRETRNFSCKCDRCADVTELGTYFSALKCPNKNCEGILLPDSFLIKQPQWACNKCECKMTSSCIERIYNSLEKKLETEDLKAFLRNQEKLLPKNHCYVVLAKLQLIVMIGNGIEGGLEDISDSNLELKISLCRQLTDILQLLAPAEQLIRGEILDHLQSSLGEMCRRKEIAGTLDVQEFRDILKERKLLLNKVVDISQYVHNLSKLYKVAKENLKEIEDLLKEI